MSPLRCQRTLANVAVVEGFGYWSGHDVRVEFHPAAAGSGLTFIRRDLPSAPRIPVAVSHRIQVPRRTTLQSQGARVEMVEHVLAALAGLEIDNCEISVDAAEMPGCDGSANEFVEALDRAGIQTLTEAVNVIRVERPLRRGCSQRWIEVRPPRGDKLTIEYQLDYGAATPIGRQKLALEITPESFRHELAPTRTFLLEEEARVLMSQGLGARVTPRDLLLFNDKGVVGNKLRFADECVRHKILDVVGDLALVGGRLVGHVVAHRSGHDLNAELVAALLQQSIATLPAARCA